MIIVEGLSKKYGSKLAVNNVSFTVPDGQVTGFLGPNGSGKSTTMRCMLGLDAPTQGRVIFRGECGGKAYDDEFAKLRNKPAVAGAILGGFTRTGAAGTICGSLPGVPVFPTIGWSSAWRWWV